MSQAIRLVVLWRMRVLTLPSPPQLTLISFDPLELEGLSSPKLSMMCSCMFILLLLPSCNCISTMMNGWDGSIPSFRLM